MLSAWRDFMIEVDPDFIVGHNMINFDLRYLMHRADHLKLTDFSVLGRFKNKLAKVTGSRQHREIKFEGRILLDTWSYLK